MQIDAQLDLWNIGEFDEIVCDSYDLATGYLGRDHVDQNIKQSNCTLSKLVLHGKLYKAIRLICKWDWGGEREGC